MRYIIMTNTNVNGNTRFINRRDGKKFEYLVKAETGEMKWVPKEWVIKMQPCIMNVGVSGDNIYPVESVCSSKKVELNKIEIIVVNTAYAHKLSATAFAELLDKPFSLGTVDNTHKYIAEALVKSYINKDYCKKVYGMCINGGFLDVKPRPFTYAERVKQYSKLVIDCFEACAKDNGCHLRDEICQDISEGYYVLYSSKTTDIEARKFILGYIEGTMEGTIDEFPYDLEVMGNSVQREILEQVVKLEKAEFDLEDVACFDELKKYISLEEIKAKMNKAKGIK